MELSLILGSALIFVSILLTPLSARIGAPILLLFLGVGMLIGEDGPGGVKFDNFQLAYDVGAIALALILFSGGLDTRMDSFKKAAAPALVLATLGVVGTGVLVGMGAYFLFGFTFPMSFLLGAVVASTDAAATFLLLAQRGVQLKGRLGETILVESGLNDPMAIFLTTVMVAIVDAGLGLNGAALLGSLPVFGLQLGLGVVFGVAGGYGLAFLTNRLTLPAGLYPVFATAGAIFLFSLTQELEGSGFLAVYLAGLIYRNVVGDHGDRVADFHEGLSWLSQIVMFLMLGLLVTPSELGKTVVDAVALGAVLMFVARPLAVSLCLAPFRMGVRETAYVSWVGLRGAVPIFLAIIPVISSGPVTKDFFNIVFVIVIMSLLFQGWTLASSAKWLKVESASDNTPDNAPDNAAK